MKEKRISSNSIFRGIKTLLLSKNPVVPEGNFIIKDTGPLTRKTMEVALQEKLNEYKGGPSLRRICNSNGFQDF